VSLLDGVKRLVILDQGSGNSARADPRGADIRVAAYARADSGRAAAKTAGHGYVTTARCQLEWTGRMILPWDLGDPL
jgi:hypothetical protein